MTLLSELKRLRDSATRCLPWHVSSHNDRNIITTADVPGGGFIVATALANDAELIALQRNCLDDFIALVEAAIAEQKHPCVKHNYALLIALEPFLKE